MLPFHALRLLSPHPGVPACGDRPLACVSEVFDLPLVHAVPVDDAAGTPYATDLAFTYGFYVSVLAFLFMRWVVHAWKTTR